MINEGDKAPDFSTTDNTGKSVKLSDYRGKKVVLYFYPRDNTPGCTKEACSFRDEFKALRSRGAQILGISPDTVASHQKFIAKYDLPFTLLTDEDRAIAKAYGVYGEKVFMGRKSLGILRTTFLIDEKGKVEKVFRKVKAEGHAAEVLASLPTGKKTKR